MATIGTKKAKRKEAVDVVSRKKKSGQEAIDDLKKEISTTKYNKATQHAIGLLKAKLARLEGKEEAKKGGGKGKGYGVKKSGDGSVILIGFPSVGKSTLLNALTKSESAVGSYAFTTLSVIPGTLEHKYARIQILDVPGIVKGAASGSGRGKQVLAVMRSADLAIILLDVHHLEHYDVLVREIRDSGLRLNELPPRVSIKRKTKGGISIGTTCKLTKITRETITLMLRELGFVNADIVIHDNITDDQLIDAIEGNKVYIPAVTIINKADTATKETLVKAKRKVKANLCVSADKKTNTEELKEIIFDQLNLIRVYCKQVSKEADLEEPLILFKNATIEDMCNKLHRTFVSKFKYARVWGPSAKFEGQKQMLKHTLKDEDIVEIHT